MFLSLTLDTWLFNLWITRANLEVLTKLHGSGKRIEQASDVIFTNDPTTGDVKVN